MKAFTNAVLQTQDNNMYYMYYFKPFLKTVLGNIQKPIQLLACF